MGIESYLVTGYEIYRPTNLDDGAGSSTEQLIKLADTTGRMRPLTGDEILANEKLNLITSHRFYCPVQEIQNGDYIKDTVKDQLYDVKFVKNPMEMDDHLEVDCKIKE